MITLQEMLLQSDGRRMLLLSARPAKWSADFRLHVPDQTIVQGLVENGKLVRIAVVPKSREKDLVNVK